MSSGVKGIPIKINKKKNVSVIFFNILYLLYSIRDVLCSSHGTSIGDFWILCDFGHVVVNILKKKMCELLKNLN